MRLFTLLITLFCFFNIYSQERLLDPLAEYRYGTIAGEEYWIFDDSKAGNPYSRNEIIWSYSGAPASAQECAKKGYAQLISWLENPDSIISQYLKLIGESGGVTSFFLWTNDYSIKKAVIKGQNPRSARIWNWEDMFLKYESTVLPNGECVIPKKDDVISTLEKMAYQQEEERRNNLNVVQRIFDGPRSKKFQHQLDQINLMISRERGATGQ